MAVSVRVSVVFGSLYYFCGRSPLRCVGFCWTEMKRAQLERLRVAYCKRIRVVIAAGFHLFPFRTEKLSPLAPMVLHRNAGE